MTNKKIKFDCVNPNKEWGFWLTWKDKKDYIPSLVGVEAKIIIEAKNEKEAIKFFKEFVKQIKEKEVEIQNE
jgi:hypothetical protein